MKRARVVEVDYDQVLEARAEAARGGHVVEPSAKARWRKEISARNLKEKAFAMVARERYAADELFIITDGPLQGLFAVERDSRVCVHFEVSEVGDEG